KNTPVTVKLKSVPLHKVLDVILSQVKEDIGYEFSDNVLTISTNELLPRNGAPRAMERVVRVYNVRDLVGKDTEVLAANATPPGVPAGLTPQPGRPTPSDMEIFRLEKVITGT